MGQGWTALMALAFIPIYIKYLGIEAYGLIGVFAILQAWLTLLDFGMTPTINREMARYTAGGHTTQSIRDLLHSLELICWVVAGAIILGVYFLSNWLASDWLKAEKLPIYVVAQAVAVMGLVVALRFIEGLYRGAIIGLQKQVWLNYMLSISATARWAGAAVVVVWVKPDVTSFFLWQGLVSVFTILMFATAVHKWLPKSEKRSKFSPEAIKNIWIFARGMLLTTLLALILTQIDKVLLSRLISLKEFGYYTLATTVVGVLYQIINPITQAYYPKFTEMVTVGDAPALTHTYHQAAQLVTVFIVSATLCLVLFGHNILQIWTNEVTVANATAPILALLALGTMLNGLMHVPYMLQLAHGWSSFAVKVNSIAIVFLVPMILWAVPKYGVIGSAWCWALLNLGHTTISMHFMYKKLLVNEKWNWYCQDIFKPSLAITICSLIGYFSYPNFESAIAQSAWILATLGLSVAMGLIASSKILLGRVLLKRYLNVDWHRIHD